ncbi:hypothetical protein A3A67_04070 [Candidatus Peribacteria bacterium RIFCSPLOWO2_01_FULL_51_18]|nr:MAG: hypothetical protein A3A67_04070 [Candidatus Peribacteria bacterium RIFCSPLOWO2_01_FULL_51_18]
MKPINILDSRPLLNLIFRSGDSKIAAQVRYVPSFPLHPKGGEGRVRGHKGSIQMPKSICAII